MAVKSVIGTPCYSSESFNIIANSSRVSLVGTVAGACFAVFSVLCAGQ